MVNTPCLLHLRTSHLAHAKATGGSSRRAALSSPNSSSSGVPRRQWGLSLMSRQSASRRRLKATTSWKEGTGTKMLRLWKPTLFSTLPFSLPEWGLVKV